MAFTPPTSLELQELQNKVDAALAGAAASGEGVTAANISHILTDADQFNVSPEQIAGMTRGTLSTEDVTKVILETSPVAGQDFINRFIPEVPTTVDAAGEVSEVTPTTAATGATGVSAPGVSPTAATTEFDPSTAVNIPSTATAAELANQNLIRQGLFNIAAGNVAVPGADLEAQATDITGTITGAESVQEIDPATQVAPDTVAAPEAITTETGATQQVAQAAQIQAGQIADVTLADAAVVAPVTEGVVSAEAQAQELDFEAAEGAQAVAAEVGEVTPGATVEAVTGTMSVEEMAKAAKVAGLEAARVDNAKQQLRKAGLSEDDIAAFANDPSALEFRLTDFTEEQRGLIGGLPVEALASTQMDRLLAGMESGDVPLWAKPAVAAVEAMLTRRGLNASTIGRDALFNSIITAAQPLAAQNAQAIKESVLQKRGFEQQAKLVEQASEQQAVLQNAQNAFNLNLTNLSNEQQAELANSTFLQTVTLTDANNEQQAAIQNAVNMANLDLKLVDSNTRLAAQNAQAFLQMDLANLSNAQQKVIVDAQNAQQSMLTNAAASNAAQQFNAESENQTNQFMASLSAQIDQFNSTQADAMEKFNITEANLIAAKNAENNIQVAEFNSQLSVQVDEFNSQQEVAVEQWNAANAQAVEQSNVNWRRMANTAETAAQNAINQQNVQNAFGLTAAAQAMLWQELRDQAAFDQQSYENAEDRKAQLYATAIGNESAAADNYDHTTHLVNLADSFFTANAPSFPGVTVTNFGISGTGFGGGGETGFEGDTA